MRDPPGVAPQLPLRTMIEPHSAHDGASACVWNETLVAPRLIVIAPVELPLPPPDGELALPLPFAPLA